MNATHGTALLLVIVWLSALLSACGAPDPRATGGSDAEEFATDASFLHSALWDDGQAEVAFYDVRRSTNQYGEPEDQQFLVGTYLVKHDYDPAAEAKAGPDADQTIQAFKYALFYELESGSYEYKRSYVTNARRSDLRPLKTSFASFDWCSNQYHDMTFHLDGSVDFLMRSDDYGNARAEFDYPAGGVPPAQVPLLIRGLDLSTEDPIHFRILLESGDAIAATAQLQGVDSLATEAGRFDAERILVRYEETVPSVVAEEADSSEIYWRATNEARTLLGVEGASGRYEMTLIEHLRSPYWEEDLYERLDRVQTRP